MSTNLLPFHIQNIHRELLGEESNHFFFISLLVFRRMGFFVLILVLTLGLFNLISFFEWPLLRYDFVLYYQNQNMYIWKYSKQYLLKISKTKFVFL